MASRSSKEPASGKTAEGSGKTDSSASGTSVRRSRFETSAPEASSASSTARKSRFDEGGGKADSEPAKKRSRFGFDEEDPLDAYMASMHNQMQEDMGAIGTKKDEAEPEKLDRAAELKRLGARKGETQHRLKQAYRAKLNQMRGPSSAD
eukprot:TRINITY_DN43722_c0_g1_i1.p1 TRINITY_DN43722_c0_g1~~TRINITY_DN43722_c0_g1_i1.p1  ORF type:complete len:149 (-),score=45.11 TRINITY_DN43722_c0_g1_i1:163-609(-)